MHNLPSGDQWTDVDIPDDDWMPSDDDDNYDRDPFENYPRLRPGGGVNSYPGLPGDCHADCYIFTYLVADPMQCAIQQILNCPDTKSIIFVGTRPSNRGAGFESSAFKKGVVPTLEKLKQTIGGDGNLWIGVKNTDKPYVEWKN